MTSWQLFTAISVAGLSVSIILQRLLMFKDKVDPIAYVILFQSMVAVVISVFAVMHDFDLSGLGAVGLPAIASIFFFGIGHIAYAKTLQVVEASVFSIFFATHAIWVMIVGVLLLGESLSTIQLLGSLLIFASIGLVVNNYRNIALDKGTLLGLLTGLLFGLAISGWSYVGRNTDALSWAAVSFAGAAAVALACRPSAIKRMKPLITHITLPKMLLLSVFYAIGSTAMLFAYRDGEFSVVSPLRQTGIVVTALLAFLFIASERVNVKKKLLAAIVCSIGVVLIVI